MRALQLQPVISSFLDHAHTVHDIPQWNKVQLVLSGTVTERLEPIPGEMAGADGTPQSVTSGSGKQK